MFSFLRCLRFSLVPPCLTDPEGARLDGPSVSDRMESEVPTVLAVLPA